MNSSFGGSAKCYHCVFLKFSGLLQIEVAKIYLFLFKIIFLYFQIILM
jgi:hypothetical protein